MAVITYRCTGCNRLIQLRENQRGLTTIGRCTITDGCAGTLSQQSRLTDSNTPRIQQTIPELATRAPRNVLFNFAQSVSAPVWTITHNLGTNPVVQVAVDRPSQERIEIEPQSVELLDKNTVRVTFSRAETGVAQILARTSVAVSGSATVLAEPQRVQLTNNGILTIATLHSNPNSSIEVNYVDGGSTTTTSYPVDYPPASASPWSDADTVVVKGREYDVGTIDINDPVVNLGISNGSSFYFSSSNFDDTGSEQDVLILLAQTQQTNDDKIKRRVYTPEITTAGSSLATTSVSGTELLAVENIFEDVYPPVFVVS